MTCCCYSPLTSSDLLWVSVNKYTIKPPKIPGQNHAKICFWSFVTFQKHKKATSKQIAYYSGKHDLFCHETSSKRIAVENATRNFTEERRILPLQMVW
jgi:hypothetical protein